MALITPPSGLINTLSWFNWPTGSFFSFKVLGVGFSFLPFNFTPGEFMIDIINLLVFPINITYELVVNASNLASSAFQRAGQAINDFNNWLLNSVAWIRDQIVNWWSATWSPIYSGLLTMINNAYNLGRDAMDWVIDAPNWIATFIDPIYTTMGLVFENYVSKISLTDMLKPFRDLVDTSINFVLQADLNALFAPVQGFMNFVDTVKQDMVDFFNDPWDFLYKKFDEFFERFW